VSLFIDSVVWIGAKLKNDQWHKASVKIINKFINREIKKVYVTDHIILESVNFILRKGGFDAALETLMTGRILLEMEKDDVKAVIKYGR